MPAIDCKLYKGRDSAFEWNCIIYKATDRE